MEEIARGAEAIITKDNNNIVKNRPKKGYRIDIIDNKLRKERTKIEASIIESSRRAGVPTPIIKEIKETEIIMEYIDGEKLRDSIDDYDNKTMENIATEIGMNIAKLHRNGIIHGDLTTSNMILKDKIHFIDFGLSSNSTSIEDQAVDLHLLEQAIKSTHLDNFNIIWNSIIEGYKLEFDNYDPVIRRLDKISERGRYKKKESIV